MVVIENVDLTSDSSDAEDGFNDKKEELPFRCMKCPLKFGQIQDAQAHFLRAHQQIKKRVSFNDDHEEFVFEKEDFEEDVSENEETIVTTIDTLEGGFNAIDNAPKNSREGEEANYCSKCDRTFKSHLWFQHHLRKKHKNISMRIEDSDNFCRICNKQYKSSMSYRNHKKNYHEGICQTCPRCKEKFEQKGILKEHMTNNPKCRKDANKDKKKKEKKRRQKEKLEILRQQSQTLSNLASNKPTIIKITKDRTSSDNIGNGLHHKTSSIVGIKIKDFARGLLKEDNVVESQLWTRNSRFVF
jgi:uncharacterized C2H2 Zn-finger protein